VSVRILPELREEYDAVMHELAEEQAVVAEIENCDQDYLEELKAAIAKQKCAATHHALVRLCADSPTVPVLRSKASAPTWPIVVPRSST
jgi:hypothetical protein